MAQAAQASDPTVRIAAPLGADASVAEVIVDRYLAAAAAEKGAPDPLRRGDLPAARLVRPMLVRRLHVDLMRTFTARCPTGC